MSDWAHSPIHLPTEGSCFITAATYLHEHQFRSRERLDYLESMVRSTFKEARWEIPCWTFFSNHYHLIAHRDGSNVELEEILREVHSQTARRVNSDEGVSERRIWFNYWETS